MRRVLFKNKLDQLHVSNACKILAITCVCILCSVNLAFLMTSNAIQLIRY